MIMSAPTITPVASNKTSRRQKALVALVLVGLVAGLARNRAQKNAQNDSDKSKPITAVQPITETPKALKITAANARNLRFAQVRGTTGAPESEQLVSELRGDEWEVAGLSPNGKVAAIVVGRRWLHIVELPTSKTLASYFGRAWGEFNRPNIAVTDTGRAAWPAVDQLGLLSPGAAGATNSIAVFSECEGLRPSAPGILTDTDVVFVSYASTGVTSCALDVETGKIVERYRGPEVIVGESFPKVPVKRLRESITPTFFGQQNSDRERWWEPESTADRFGDGTDELIPGEGGYVDKSGTLIRPMAGPFQSAGVYAIESREGSLRVHLVDGKEVGPIKGVSAAKLGRASRVTRIPGPKGESAKVALANGKTHDVPAGYEDLAESKDGSLVAVLGYERSNETESSPPRWITLVDTSTARVKRVSIQGGDASLTDFGSSGIVLLYNEELFTIDQSSFSVAESWNLRSIQLRDQDDEYLSISGTNPNIAVSPDDSLLAVDSRDRLYEDGIELFSLPSGQRIGAVNNVPEIQTGLRFSDDGTELLVGDNQLAGVLRVAAK
jgi:hypothetical protein